MGLFDGVDEDMIFGFVLFLSLWFVVEPMHLGQYIGFMKAEGFLTSETISCLVLPEPRDMRPDVSGLDRIWGGSETVLGCDC